ncbi:MAG: hypothetical protein C0476_09330 [Sphingomonas sp.]|nr:hypothetical protein [Sphingomonas sp.]
MSDTSLNDAPRPRRRRTRPAAPPAVPAPDAAGTPQVFIRLYRARLPGASYKGLLGDCFLIRIVAGGVQSTILIDCGILLGSPDAAARMAAIGADIVKETGGTLDLLVVTHEHWDHVSGFDQARDVFLGDPATGTPPKLKIAQMWMAWTEDLADPDASALRARFDKTGTALALLAERMAADRASGAASPFAAAPEAATLGLEKFLGPLGDDPTGDAGLLGAGGGKRLTGRAIFEALKSVSVATRYLSPGTVLSTPTASPLRAYVLGPPRNLKRLFKDLPTKAEHGSLYLDRGGYNAALMLDVARGADADDLARHSPFSRRYTGIHSVEVEAAPDAGPDAPEPARIRAWLRGRYFDSHVPCRFGDDAPPKHDCAKDLGCGARQGIRRIDGDWLAAAGPLALKLDADTNNTSLVLAFELPDASIMLFAADAQVGNWESWHDQDYSADGRAVTAVELLARTRFYKVGHHGSHNATLTDQGLERMTRDDLVAAISTDFELGRQQGSKGWNMPNERVKAALLRQSKGRLIRSDRDRATDDDVAGFAADPDFVDRLRETPLYIEYRVFG